MLAVFQIPLWMFITIYKQDGKTIIQVIVFTYFKLLKKPYHLYLENSKSIFTCT